MRNRLEDIGRALVMVENIYDHELFQKVRWSRAKDACDWFDGLEPEKKDDFIHEVAYEIRGVSEQLSEVISILRGTDFLNNFNEGANDPTA